MPREARVENSTCTYHEVRSGAAYRTVPREARQQNVRTEKGKGIALRYRIEYRVGSNNMVSSVNEVQKIRLLKSWDFELFKIPSE